MFVVIFIGSSSTIIIRIEVYMFHIMGIHMHTYCSRCIPDSMSQAPTRNFYIKLHKLWLPLTSNFLNNHPTLFNDTY